jgi:hypothetical protein
MIYRKSSFFSGHFCKNLKIFYSAIKERKWYGNVQIGNLENDGAEEEVESGQVPYAVRKMMFLYFRNERKRVDGDATSEQ